MRRHFICFVSIIVLVMGVGVVSAAEISIDSNASSAPARIKDDDVSPTDTIDHSTQQTTYYISPYGNDGNSGLSEGQAWATFDRAWQDLYPGDTLVLMDGIYYQSIRPNIRNGQAGSPITIRAQNDGRAIIDGQGVRVPVQLDGWPAGSYYVIEGIVARNSVEDVYYIRGDHNVLRRVSGYNAHTDHNTSVFKIWANDTLLEDCAASGTGRKMILIYQGSHNVVRRCFADWRSWAGRQWCDAWPWGDNIQIYNGNYNIIENSIAYGSVPLWSISVQANADSATAIGNRVLGSIAMHAGMNHDGTVRQWPGTRPQPTSCTAMRDFGWGGQRAGVMVYGQGEIRDNLFQDIVSYGNAGLGFASAPGTSYHPNNGNNRINRATIFENGIDNPEGPWPAQYGGVGIDALQHELSHFIVENSVIENVYVDWPNYPNGPRNTTSYDGVGADLTNRYVDGQLTKAPLWPWPMQRRIERELGISVIGDIASPLGISGFTLSVEPTIRSIAAGGATTFTLHVEPAGDFTDTVDLDMGNVSSRLNVNVNSTSVTPPGDVTLAVQHIDTGSSSTSGAWHTIPVTATSTEITKTIDVTLLVDGSHAYLPAIADSN